MDELFVVHGPVWEFEAIGDPRPVRTCTACKDIELTSGYARGEARPLDASEIDTRMLGAWNRGKAKGTGGAVLGCSACREPVAFVVDNMADAFMFRARPWKWGAMIRPMGEA